MALNDYGLYYNETGSVSQIEYAAKSAANSNTIIGFKYKTGVILASENPVISRLYKPAENIKKLGKNASLLFTGLKSDGGYIYELIKDRVMKESEFLDDFIGPGFVERSLGSELHEFTVYLGCRPVGCSFISAMAYENKFYLLGATCDSQTEFCSIAAYGKGAQRCKTELEKLDIGNLTLTEAIEQAVKALYLAFDPLKDKPFNIEMAYFDVCSDYNLTKVDQSAIQGYVDVYQELSGE